jgi:hypothetical protein
MENDSKRLNAPGPKKRPPLRASDLSGFKYFGQLDALLASLHDHADGPNRKLHYDQYVSLILLYFFNPVLTSLRGIQQASALPKVQEKLGLRRASLGSLSESARVFDPQLLEEIVQDLAGQAQTADAPARPDGLDETLEIIARDGTLLPALPKMAWALWLDEEHRAAKLHLEFNVLKGAPQFARLSEANAGECAALRADLRGGQLYLLDAGHNEYALFEDIRNAGSSFVARLRDNAVCDLIEERPLTDADRAAGVTFDRVVRLGSPTKREALTEPVRLVQVHVRSASANGLARRRSRVSSKKTFRHVPEAYDLLLMTDQLDLPAETIGLLYRWRWMIELFFRWLKCTVRFRHLLSESADGIQIQMYCALIATLLIVLWTGRKPTKRTWEMVQFYFQGWASAEDLQAHIAGLERSGA